MDHLPAKEFQKAYLRWTLIPLLCFVIFAIPGMILLVVPETGEFVRWIGGGLVLLAALSLAISIRTSIKGKKRFVNLPAEFYQDELKRSLDVERQFDLSVIPLVSGSPKEAQKAMTISPKGVAFGETALAWNELARPQTVLFQDWWYFAFGTQAYSEEGWTGFLTPAYDLIADLIKHYRGEALDDTKFQATVEEQRQIQESTSEWGKNGLLFLEMGLYYGLVFLAFIALGVALETTLGEGFGVVIGTFFILIGVAIGHPLFFKNRIKSKYLLNKIGFGHAKGKRHFFLPWDKIDTLVVDGKHLYVHFHEEQDGEGIPYTLRIASNAVLMEKIQHLIETHGVSIRIRNTSEIESQP